MIFKNKKPTLFGSPEDSTAEIDTLAIAGLTGDLTKSLGTTTGTTGSNVNLSALQSGEVLVGTIIVTPFNPLNLIIMRFSQFATQDSNIQIREGATVIATVDGSSTGGRVINTSIEDASVETHTYSCYTQFDTLQYQYAQTGGTILYGSVVNLTDTHAADITTPATAIKQINSPDSHTTKKGVS